MAFEDQTGFDYSKISRSSTPSSSGTGSMFSSVKDLLNPVTSRVSNLINKGLFPGGGSSLPKQTPNIGFTNQDFAGAGATGLAENDWRVRLSLGDNAQFFYKSYMGQYDIQTPLLETGGVIWPYTPTISVTQIANYASSALTHSNYPSMFYNNSEVSDINISGQFTVQSIKEGQYLLAVIYFLRACTKMFFGQGQYAGNPPPVLFLNGYGSYYFPNVPVVITSFAHTLPEDVDYIDVPINITEVVGFTQGAPAETTVNYKTITTGQVNTNGALQNTTSQVEQGRTTNFGGSGVQEVTKTITNSTRLPASSTITVTVRPVYSRKNLHDNFDLEKFASGELIRNRTPGSGGFI